MSIGSLKLKRGAVGGGEGIKRVVSYYTDVLSLFLLYILVNICPRLFVYSYITGMLSQRDYANITDRLGLCSLFFFVVRLCISAFAMVHATRVFCNLISKYHYE